MSASLPRDVLGMVLAGGEGKRLMPLTLERAKPAVPFGGHYRLIDFALSNLVNGGYRKIVVLTQYKSHSLNVHLARTWRMSTLLGNYVTSVPAQMRMGKRWFLGSADALLQNINIIDDEEPSYVFAFGADHIYRMDPRQMLEHHLSTGAGVTVAGIRVPIGEAPSFGVIERGATSLIENFREKPSDPKPTPDDPSVALVSMGNYVFTTSVLLDLLHADSLRDDSRHDVGGDLIPSLVAEGQAHVYDFTENEVPGVTEREKAYWRDVGTIDSYFDAHMDLVSVDPVFNLYNEDWPIYTSSYTAPPAKVVAVAEHGAGDVADSILSSGVVISGGYVRNSVLSPWVRVEPGAIIENAVLLENVRIGAGAQVRNAILDKNVVVEAGASVGVDPSRDQEMDLTMSDNGITTVGKNVTIR
ncbi:MAG: glucose-1-phosphate adenylyltransferase [Acidimicrobiia bacterium]|nr:glucose-1-phosphate adenylyltransferase [Acidimicrobiia bacterium]MDH5294750.1 glucose-1-phosphate adenylyltransferase [Acidimicrobiia bacterium]